MLLERLAVEALSNPRIPGIAVDRVCRCEVLVHRVEVAP